MKWEFHPRLDADQFDAEKSLHNKARFGPIDEKRVETYAEAMKRGDQFPPVIAHGKMGKLVQADGNQALGNRCSSLPDERRSVAPPEAVTTSIADSAWEASERAAQGLLGTYRGASFTAYTCDLKDLWRWAAGREQPPLRLTRSDLDDYVRHLIDERHLAPATVRRRLCAVQLLYAHAVEEGLLESNPASRMRRPRRQHTPPRVRLTTQDMKSLLQAAEADGARSGLLVHLLLLYGARVGAALQASVEDVRGPLARRQLVLRVKGGGLQELPLTAATALLVEELAEGRSEGPLLRSASGARWHRTNAAARLRVLGKRVLEPSVAARLHPHALRRAFIDCSIGAGVPLNEVQFAVGHRSGAMTMAYCAEFSHRSNPVAWQVARLLAEPVGTPDEGVVLGAAGDVEPGCVAGVPKVNVSTVLTQSVRLRRDENAAGRRRYAPPRKIELARMPLPRNARSESTHRSAQVVPRDETVDRAGEPVRLPQLVIPGAGQRHDERELGGEQLVAVETDQVGVLADRVQTLGAQAAVALLRQPADWTTSRTAPRQQPRGQAVVTFLDAGGRDADHAEAQVQ